MTKCAQKRFWSCGVKIKSGEARTFTGSEWLDVVLRKAKPGQINVHELPAGAALWFHDGLVLQLNQETMFGRKGRQQSTLAMCNELDPARRAAYLQRVVDSRSDAEMLEAVVVHSSGTLLPAALVKASQHADVLLAKILADEGRLNQLDSVVLMELTKHATSAGVLKAVQRLPFHWVLATVGERAAEIGLAHEVHDVLHAKALSAFRDGTFSKLNSVEQRDVRAALSVMGEQGAAASFQELLGLATASGDKQAWLYVGKLLNEHVTGIQGPALARGCRVLTAVLATLDVVPPTLTAVRLFDTLADDDMTALVAQTSRFNVSVTQRNVERQAGPYGIDLQWGEVGRDQGLPAASVLQLHQEPERERLVTTGARFDESFLRNVVLTDVSSLVRAAGLLRLGDDQAWLAAFDSTDGRGLQYVAHAPVRVLREVWRRHSVEMDPLLVKALIRRGAVSEHEAAASPRAVTRRAVAEVAMDEQVLAVLVGDADTAVVASAGMNTASLATWEQAVTTLAARPDHGTVGQALAQREMDLRRGIVAREAAEASDLATARGAIEETRDVAVLWSLQSVEPLAAWATRRLMALGATRI